MSIDLMQTQPAIGQDDVGPCVDRSTIAPFFANAKRDGIDIKAILKRHGGQASEPLPLIDYFKIERDIARAMDDLTAHLSTRKLTYQTGSFVVDQVKKATSLAEAMTSLAEYFNMMHGGTYNTVQRTPQTISLITDDSAFPYSMTEPEGLVELIGECVQVKVHCLLDSISGGIAAEALQRVGIRRSALTQTTQHLRFWPRAPQTGRSTYTLTYDLSLASRTIPKPEKIDLSSDGIFSRVIDHLDQTGETHRDKRLIAKVLDLIEEGEWLQDRVADHLGVSVATLRRRLSEDSLSFRDLVQEARLRRAERLLLQGRTTQQVTEALNYSDIRAFNRAFKRWKGTTPAAFAKGRNPTA